jgi:hypothetical protein
MTEEHDGAPESVLLFVETARALSARLRNDAPAPCSGEPVRVHDGSSPLTVQTDLLHGSSLANVRLHRHLSWQPSMQIDVFGDGSTPSGPDLGTDTATGTADLLDMVVGLVENRRDHAPAYDLLQTVADVCGAVIGPVPTPIIVHAPTPWSATRLHRADEVRLDLPDEIAGLLAAIPVMVSPTFWIQSAREDVPAHPRASLRGWSVVARPTDPITVTRAILAYPANDENPRKAAPWA